MAQAVCTESTDSSSASQHAFCQKHVVKELPEGAIDCNLLGSCLQTSAPCQGCREEPANLRGPHETAASCANSTISKTAMAMRADGVYRLLHKLEARYESSYEQ